MNKVVESVMLGVLEPSTPRRLTGWVFIKGRAEALEVELLLNGHRVVSVTANQFRPGLLLGGKHPTGYCGFVIHIPQKIALCPGDRLLVRAVGYSGSITRSQCSVVASSTGDLILETVPDRLRVSESEGDVVDIPIFAQPAPRLPWVIFLNSIGALFLREVSQRYGASRFGYPWAIAQPLVALLILTAAHSMFAGSDVTLYGVSSSYFLLLGIMPFFLFLQAYHHAMGAIASGRGTLSYPSVRPFDLVIVRCGIEAMIMLVVMLLSICGVWWLGGRMEAEDPLGLLSAVALLFVMAMGLGLIADVEISRNEDSRRIFGLIERPLFFVSGVFYAVDVVPEPARSWLMWNPILHAIDLGRGAMLRGYVSPCSWTYLSFWSFGFLFVGLAMYRRNLPRLLSV